MAAKTVNISNLFENNLRRVSEVGVATMCAVLAVGGDRLGQADDLAVPGDKYNVFTIPADSIVTSISILVDESFGAGVKAGVKTINGQKAVGAAVDVAAAPGTLTKGTPADPFYCEKADGFEIILTGTVTNKGKFRVIAEYISADTNNGIYIDNPAV